MRRYVRSGRVARGATILAGLLVLMGLNGDDDQTPSCWPRDDTSESVRIVLFKKLDFRPPGSAGWNVKWVQPGQPLQWSDVKKYPVDMALKDPTASAVTYDFEVRAARWWIVRDPLLGRLEAHFPSGSQTPDRILYKANAGANVTPPGAQDITGAFWLGCTGKRGRVRGNAGHDNDRHAKVYLKFVWPVEAKSPEHVIRCIK